MRNDKLITKNIFVRKPQGKKEAIWETWQRWDGSDIFLGYLRELLEFHRLYIIK
jgi:hypothetical protein